MPKIQAPTVREHREQIRARLIDAAEEILRTDGELTAAAVSERAGIARNSIYRYVESVDDLQGLVLARHLPGWLAGVRAALVGMHEPRERVLTWCAANLDQAAESGHGWLMGLRQGATGQTESALDTAHGDLAGMLRDAWAELAGPEADFYTQLSQAMLRVGFAAVDAGEPVSTVRARTVSAVAAVVDDVRNGTDPIGRR